MPSLVMRMFSGFTCSEKWTSGRYTSLATHIHVYVVQGMKKVQRLIDNSMSIERKPNDANEDYFTHLIEEMPNHRLRDGMFGRIFKETSNDTREMNQPSVWAFLLAVAELGLNVETFALFPCMDDFQDVLVRCQRFVKTNFFQFLIPTSRRDKCLVEYRSLDQHGSSLPIRFATEFCEWTFDGIQLIIFFVTHFVDLEWGCSSMGVRKIRERTSANDPRPRHSRCSKHWSQ